MVQALIAAGFIEKSAIELAPLFTQLVAEGRDPTPAEVAIIKAGQRSEEDDFNHDLPK